MPRQARKRSKSGIYHIMLRGINRQMIFKDTEDYLAFTDTVKKLKSKGKFELYAYCIMGNHVHLLLREKDESISRIIQKISSRFVYWYNDKYDRCGHLFQERFKSEVVEDDTYLLTVLRYIHQNPVKAGIVHKIDTYTWSSYRDYINGGKWVDTDFILKLFCDDKQESLDRFTTYMNQDNDDICLEHDEKHRLSDSEVMRIIKEKYGVNNGLVQSMMEDKRKRIIRNLKTINGITIRQIARVTGVSKYRVEKA